MRLSGHPFPAVHVLKFLTFSAVLVLATQLPLWLEATRSFAQDEAGPSESLAEEDAESTEPADPPRRSSDADEEAPKQTLLNMLWVSGWCGFFIFICSLVSVAFIVEHALTIRRGKLVPEEVVEELDALIEQGQVDEAIVACQKAENVSLISNVVLAGLERYQGSEFGPFEYRAAAEEAGEEQTSRLYRKTEVLSVIGAIAPMLGLLGTVSGMISAFNVIASTKGAARPYQLASGISEALVTTYMGLVVAIPTMIFFSYFRNKIDSLVAEAGKRAEQILMPLGRRR